MVVLDIKCKKCKNMCGSIYFQQNFKNWTSGNNDIDKFIQSTQLSAHNNVLDVLEWIPYDRFHEIRYIAKGMFGMYNANWFDGNISYWDYYDQNWIRDKPSMAVTLKILNNPASITSEFVNKVYKVYYYINIKKLFINK
jgi:hypothetical protein